MNDDEVQSFETIVMDKIRGSMGSQKIKIINCLNHENWNLLIKGYI